MSETNSNNSHTTEQAQRRRSAVAAATQHSDNGSAIAATTTNKATNEGKELDESEDENGTYEDETMHTRRGKSRIRDSIVDIENLDLKSEDE
jgi:hypothetical protein